MTQFRCSAAGLVALLSLALTGCSAGEEVAVTPDSATALSGELTIFAAASLSGAFDQLAEGFETANPAVDVRPITYDGSSVLAAQLLEGAPADVFASADEHNMTKITDSGLAFADEPFATNALEIAVAPGNPHGIESIDALADDELTIVLCAAEVPCGAAAERLIEAAAVTIRPASEEQNVTAVLSKVKSAEADAGIVYRTDIQAAGDEVTGIEIPNADDAINVYPIVSLADAPNPVVAAAFVDYVRSPIGQKILTSYGFGTP